MAREGSQSKHDSAGNDACAGGREVPLLLVAADQDACLPMDGMYELFERAPGPKKMVVLELADHMHFVDDVEKSHEAFRTMPMEGERPRSKPICARSQNFARAKKRTVSFRR